MRWILIVVFLLISSMTAAAQQSQPQGDDPVLKATEIALIRLRAAEDTIKLLSDRLTAKDEIIEAQKGVIAVRDEQLKLARSMDTNSQRIQSIDQFRVEACQQQLAKADAEIFRLRHPGILASIFDKRTLTGAIVGFGIGRATSNQSNPFLK